MRRRDRLRPLLAAAIVSAAMLLTGPALSQEGAGWATAQAMEQTRQGREHAAHGEVETAARRYHDAIGFDVTYGPAYLALGSLQEASGDPREAERTYAMGIDHVAGFAEGYRARGSLRERQKRLGDAVADFEAAAALAPDDLETLRRLGGAYVASSALPAALAIHRRMAALAEEQGDAKAAGEARVGIKALAMLVGDVDPVAAGAAGRGRVRRALWLLGRRR